MVVSNQAIALAEAGRIIAAARRTGPQACTICATVVIATSRRRFCSTPCRLKADYARHAERRKANRRARYRRQRKLGQAGPMYARHCEHCGRLDLRTRYESLGQADAVGVWKSPWACEECGGSDFVLVEEPHPHAKGQT